MGAKDIWYGVLEAGEKSSPVVRDASLETGQNKIYLYNYVRNNFVEYSQAIVEPKLRELTEGDISQDKLDKAFKAARQAFLSSHKTRSWSDTKSTTSRVKRDEQEDEADIDITDDDEIEEFIDDD
ncbi:MAG: hypothetical protein OEZ15_05875 [Gammaproteobacteria bacterium]|nr:hypothetical protein [Gammaproteobacteria bacterium]